MNITRRDALLGATAAAAVTGAIAAPLAMQAAGANAALGGRHRSPGPLCRVASALGFRPTALDRVQTRNTTQRGLRLTWGIPKGAKL